MSSLSIPHDFVEGTTIEPDEVDANFSAVATAVNNIDNDNIQDESVSGTKIKKGDDGIVTNRIKDSAVTTTKIADANVTAAKLATNAVETAKIKDANVTAAKLGADAVETAKIKDANVTTPKLADAAVQKRYFKFTTTDLALTASFQAIPGLTQSVEVASGETVVFQVCVEYDEGEDIEVKFLRDSTQVQETYAVDFNSGSSPVAIMLLFFDSDPGAATYSYSLEIRKTAGGSITVTKATGIYTVDRGK